MSLTLPATYSGSSKLSNIQENWIAQLFHQESHLSFDGANDYIDLGTTTSASAMSLGSSDDLTVAFWINFPTLGTTEQIFSNNSQASDYSGVFIYKAGNNKIAIAWGDGSGTGPGDRESMLGSTALSIDTWYFIVITTDFSLTTTNTVIRVNNSAETVENTGTASITSPVYESGTAYFGRRGSDYGEIKIRNFGIWAGELDSNNLTALYNSGNYFSFLEDSGNYDQASALKGYWEFNNGDNTTQDKAGNGANGTISGAVYEDFLPIALSDTTVGSVFYHGAITSRPNIRTSINLSKSTAKTGNISLSIANFNYKGDDFSAELFLGTRKYINRNVRIYSQLNEDSTLANCLQVYSGRLTGVSHDVNSIKLSITERRPWDFISIPQDVSTKGNYFPVVYGSYAVNSSTYASPAYSAALAKTVHPVHIDKSSYFYYPLVHEDYGSTDTTLHYYEPSLDSFIPLEDSNDAEAYDSGYTVPSKWDIKRHFKVKPISFIGSHAWTNSSNAIDGTSDQTGSGSVATVDFGDESDTSAPYTVTLTRTNTINLPAVDDPPLLASSDASDNYGLTLEVNWKATNVYCITNSTATVDGNHIAIKEVSTGSTIGLLDFSGTAGTQVIDEDEDEDSGVTITQRTFSLNLDTVYKSSGGFPDGIQMKFERLANVLASGGSLVKIINDDGANLVSVYDIRAKCTLAIDRKNDTTDGTQRIASIKTLYSGHDGFAKSFSGGSGTASTGLEAHRDLLIRYAGWDDTNANIYNYDANLDIEAARVTSAWNIRWWEHSPVELKKILDRMQFEFGFIFKFRADGTGSYWYIKNSYASGDVAQTLNKDDIASLQINNTPFSELITKMEINYEKHPAENRHISNLTSIDTTNNQRTTWNILAKENIKKIDLNMNVNKPGNANPGGGNPNDGFADYYMNIFGDIKKIISCDIINSAKGYNLETGDIVQFSNTAGEMPVDPFGDNWADYYMVTDLVRGLGTVKIKAREVG